MLFQGLETIAPRWCHCKGTVLIDEVSMCAHCAVHRPSPSARASSSTAPPSERVIGIDPRRVDIILAVGPLQHRTLKRTTLSAGKCYHDSGVSSGTRQDLKWRNPNNDIEVDSQLVMQNHCY